MSPGELVIVAGPSCCGKTTLAQAVTDAIGLPWMFWEIDRVGPRLPESAVIKPDQVKELTLEQLSAALEVQDRLVAASLGAIRAYLDVGFSLVAELFLFDNRHMHVAARALKGVTPLVIELRCPVEVLEEREAARATTYSGTARAQAGWNWLIVPDLVLDGTRSVAALAGEVASWLHSHPKARWPEALARASADPAN